MKKLWLLIATAAIASPVCAAQYTFELKPESTKVEWTLNDVLHTVHGSFRLKNGSITFDPDTGAASGEVTVDVTSGQSGSGARDRRMHENVLESSKFPEAVFVPDRVDGKLMLTGDSDVKIHGTFRIHGASHDMTMNARTHAGDGHLDASLTFSVPYVSWGMKDPSTFVLKVSKTVEFAVQASGALDRR